MSFFLVSTTLESLKCTFPLHSRSEWIFPLVYASLDLYKSHNWVEIIWQFQNYLGSRRFYIRHCSKGSHCIQRLWKPLYTEFHIFWFSDTFESLESRQVDFWYCSKTAHWIQRLWKPLCSDFHILDFSDTFESLESRQVEIWRLSKSSHWIRRLWKPLYSDFHIFDFSDKFESLESRQAYISRFLKLFY